MRPAYQKSVIILIIGMLILINAGCGKKHLHVSTMSGAPGEEELVMITDSSEDQSGLGGSGLDESGLGNDGAHSSPEDLEPLDFTYNPTLPSTHASDSSSNTDLFAELDDQTATPEGLTNDPSAPGQDIQSQSQSPFLPPLVESLEEPSNLDETFRPAMGSNLSNLDSSSQPSQGAADSSEDLPPLVAFTNPDESTSDNLFDLGNANEETTLPVEQIPGNIAVAKAEPTDAFREQLDEMKEEEAAALAAGLSDVFFEFDSWTLTSEGRQALEQGAEWLQGEASSKLLVEGHCDSRGTQAYNLVLGKKRAGAIRDYLVELGITPDRVAIISYGQDRPFCTDTTEVCFQLNRRGHLLVQNP
ncbi:MAG: OmpA family protein [Nitrospirales bacterium]|nr:OmpA family protein [Nitrospira sp.]MDR4501192.1 OmpA family protein [Nitrospirales bacterium]